MALITPQQVVELAFNDSDFVTSDTILNSDITAAELRYIKPILGSKLYAKLLSQNKTDILTNEFLAPAISIATRLIILPMFAIKTGRFGMSTLQPSNHKSVNTEELSSIRKALRLKLHIHLQLITDHLDNNPQLYPEYDPHQNILNRCSISGGFIQNI